MQGLRNNTCRGLIEMLKLIVKDNEGGEAQFPVVGELIIGREDDCQIILSDQKVSRKHAKVYAEFDEAFIEDLGSSNGTKVNGEKITGVSPIKPGYQVTIGTNRLWVIETNPLMDFAGTTQIGKASPDTMAEKMREDQMHRPMHQRNLEDVEQRIPSRKPVSVQVKKTNKSMFWLFVIAAAAFGGALIYYFAGG